jgi:chromosome segregation ATPase
MRAANTFSLAAAELVRERDVLLHALADAAENWAKLRQERDRFKGQLVELENTIATLRSKGRRAVADRDKWEEVARRHECELAELRAFAGDHDRFKRVKAFISKTLHPDTNRNAGEIETIARTLLFKEIWPEIVNIDRGTS